MPPRLEFTSSGRQLQARRDAIVDKSYETSAAIAAFLLWRFWPMPCEAISADLLRYVCRRAAYRRRRRCRFERRRYPR